MKTVFKLSRNSKIFLWLGFLVVFLIGVIVSKSYYSGQKMTAYEELSQVHTKCYELRPRSKYLECMRVKMQNVVENNSAIELVEAGAKIDRVRNVVFDREINCHVMMHAVGRGLSEYKDNFDEVVSSCKPLCGAGCYHGIMEGRYKLQGDISAFLSDACESLNNKGTILSQNCFHGLGHAIAIKNWDLDKSLNNCDFVSAVGRGECGKGVFMELFSRSEQTLMPLPLDVPSWCNSFETIYSDSCWIFAANIRGTKNEFLEQKGIDTTKLESEPIYNCSKSPKHMVAECYKLVGYGLYDALGKNGVRILAICENLGEAESEYCVNGVVERDLEETRFKNGINTCDFISDQELKRYCEDIYKNPLIN